MVSMLIVEDEKFERDALCQCINWEVIGVSVVGEAATGLEGLELAKKLTPHIVLSDIKMPGMNGLEMAKAIRAVSPETEIVFLSSYDDFEYAQQAISLNIFAYMTKPFGEMELLKVVKRAADKVIEGEMERILQQKMQQDYQSRIELVRQAVAMRVLNGISPYSTGQLQELHMDWLLHSKHLCMVVACYTSQWNSLVCDNITHLVQELRHLSSAATALCINSGSLVAIVSCYQTVDAAKLQQIAQQTTAFLEELGCCDAHCYSVCKNGEELDVAALYLELLQKNVVTSPVVSDIMFQKKRSKQQIVDGVKAIIDEQFGSPLTIETIAKMLHFTPNYIGTIFKSQTQESINHYLMRVRLEKAEQFLRDTALPITDIARMCGYDNSTYFHTIFKKEKKLTPVEFRQQIES